MTTKADFTDEEWVRLSRAPVVAGLAISLADPGGPIEAVKESMASLRTVAEAAKSEDGPELVTEIAKSVTEKRENPLGDFKPKGATAGQEILDELRAANELAKEKATPEEAAAYREWLLSAAQRAAEAAKEGGFLGFKAERVSEGEQKMLDRLGAELT
jgi:hypothetical protein